MPTEKQQKTLERLEEIELQRLRTKKREELVISGDGSREAPLLVNNNFSHRCELFEEVILEGLGCDLSGKLTFDTDSSEDYPDGDNLRGYDVHIAGQEVKIWFDHRRALEPLENHPIAKLLTTDQKEKLVVRLEESLDEESLESIDKKTDSLPMFAINAQNEDEAIEKIWNALQPYFDQGWKVKSSYQLIDGWKNTYLLSRGHDELLTEFDMKPSLPKFTNTLTFTIGSGFVGNGASPQEIRAQKKADREEDKKSDIGCLIIVVIIVIVIVAINM